MDLLRKIAEALSGDKPEVQTEMLGKAAQLLEKALGRPPSDWDEDVGAASVDAATIDSIERMLVEYLQRNLRAPPPVAAALWALSLLESPDHRPLLIQCVERFARWDGDAASLHQALVGLERLGEHIFPDGRSSVREVERNVKCGQDFLATLATR